MKGLRLSCVLGFLVAISLCGITLDAALAQCVPDSGPENGYNTCYHNSGLYPNCIQDYDLDMPEYKGFVSEFSEYLFAPGTPVVADYFGVSCPFGEEAHGYTVERYFEFAYPSKHVEYVENTGLTWAEMIQYILMTESIIETRKMILLR